MTMGTSIVGLPWCDTGAWRGVSRRWPARWVVGVASISGTTRRGGRLRLLEVGQRRMVRVGGQPVVDQLLDQAAPAQRAADEAPAALRLEVVQQAPVVRVALAALGDLGLDVLVGDLDALLVGDLGQHEQRLDALLGVRAELGVEVGVGLLDDLEVGLLGDALASEARPELVVHHLDLLVDQHLGQLDGGVGDGVLDDPVGELVARAVEGVALEAVLDVGPQRGEVVEVAELAREVVVEVGQDLLAQLLELDREVRRLARPATPRGSRRGT